MRSPLLALGLAAASAAYGQFTDSVGYNYNNANSALIGTIIQNNVRANMLRSALMSSRAMYGAGGAGGRTGGRISLRFTPRTPPLEKWLQAWSGGDPEKRRAMFEEYRQQRTIWQAETKARATQANDLAQVMATAFVLAYEGYTGRRASATGYRRMVDEFRKGFGKDPGLRGASNDRMNEIAESAMLESTDSAMRRRGGTAARDPLRIAKAKEVGVRFLDRWWDEKRAGAVALLDAKGGAPTSPPAAPSFAQAIKITSFRPVAPTVLPERLAKSLPQKEHRAMAEKVSRDLLGQVRTGLKADGAGDVPVDNVGRGLVFALTMLRHVALSTPGRPVGEGVADPAREQVVALRRELLINLAAKPEMKRMTDREKQELTETLLFLPAFTELLYRLGQEKGDLEAQKAARDAASQAFQSFFGTKPEAFRFEG